MAGNDFILRPKVDLKTLKAMTGKLSREVGNSLAKASKASANVTQKAFTHALKASAKAGGSALHSAMQVGMGGAMDLVKQMMTDVDDTLDRIEGRIKGISDINGNAGALGMTGTNLAIMTSAGIKANLGQDETRDLIQTFKDSLTNPDMVNFKAMARDQGTGRAMISFLKQYSGNQQAMQGAGFTGTASIQAARLMQVIGSSSSMGQLAKSLGMNPEQVQNSLFRNQYQQNIIAQGNAQRFNNNLMQRTNGNGNLINSNLNEVQNRQFIQEGSIQGAMKVREKIQTLMDKIRTLLSSLIERAGDLIDAYNKGGISGAMSEVITPLIKSLEGTIEDKLTSIETTIKTKIDDLIGSNKILQILAGT